MVPSPTPPLGDQHLSPNRFSNPYPGTVFILQCKHHHSVLLVLLLYQPLTQAITGVDIH